VSSGRSLNLASSNGSASSPIDLAASGSPASTRNGDTPGKLLKMCAIVVDHPLLDSLKSIGENVFPSRRGKPASQ